MLEKILEKTKNNQIIYCDAHCHLVDCKKQNCLDSFENLCLCNCVLSKDEYQSFITDPELNSDFYSIGIHPQFVSPDKSLEIEEMLNFMDALLSEKSNCVSAIGEIGFDFFTPEAKENSELQEKIFIQQMNLAIKYNKPVVIHCRKANHKLFEHSKLLKNVPAVLFHSFIGTFADAESLLNHGINGFFSFGKQIMNNNKKAIDCVKNLPMENLLLETDAPFQFLKGESFTKNSDIKKIYQTAYNIRSENPDFADYTFYDFCNILFRNLIYLYHGKQK